MKDEIKGIILRISCFKYKEIRKQFEIKENNILGWKVINVYGNINLNEDYKFDNNNLIIKCEDTYLHLTTKLILSFKILNEIYNIKEGILRCGDDLIFNIDNLKTFLNIKNKSDYVGKNFLKKDILNPINNIDFKSVDHTNFMINYYNNHIDDKKYIINFLEKYNICLGDLKFIPSITNQVGLGHIYYLSTKSIKIVINHFLQKDSNLKFSIIKENDFYPYFIEDISIGYILFKKNINFTNYPEMWLNNHYQGFDTEKLEYICVHTNEGNIF